MDSVLLEEEMIASLEGIPTRNRIDVEAARHELSPGALSGWVLPFGAILSEDSYEVLRIPSVEAALVMIEL